MTWSSQTRSRKREPIHVCTRLQEHPGFHEHDINIGNDPMVRERLYVIVRCYLLVVPKQDLQDSLSARLER